MIYDLLSLVDKKNLFSKSVLIIRFYIISTKVVTRTTHIMQWKKIFSSRLLSHIVRKKYADIVFQFGLRQYPRKDIVDGKSKIASIINISQYFYIYSVKSFFNIPLKNILCIVSRTLGMCSMLLQKIPIFTPILFITRKYPQNHNK